MLTFNARLLGRAWLAVTTAAASDKHRPALNRTISIEEYPHGVLLTSTDSVALLHSWVPALDHELDPPPLLGDAPTYRAVAMDPHSRGRGFLAHALRLADDAADNEYGATVEVTLRLDATDAELGDDPGPARTLDGFELRHVVLDLPGAERLKLTSYDGSYPDWRRVVDAFTPRRTNRLALNTDVVARLAKIGKVYKGAVLGWTFGGPEKMARVELIDATPAVVGVVMPCRWDFDTDAPRDDDPTPPPATNDTAADEADGAADVPNAAPDDTADTAPPADPPILRFDPDEAEALRYLADLGELTEGPANSREARTIARHVVRRFLERRWIRRVRFTDDLRSVYELAPDGKDVL